MRQSSSQTRNRLVVVCMAVSLVAGVLFFSSRALMQGGATLADDFNDNSLDTTKWDPNNLFSGFTDTSLPVAETNQQFEIGPLLQNTSGSHYRGIRTVNTYTFTNSYSYVELVQAPSSSTVADAMFTVGTSVDNYYRLYVSGGTLYGLRKAGGTKTTLFTLAYNTTNHRFLRIRHDSNTGNVTLDTATGSGGVPGTWVQQYSEAWNSSIALTGIIFEMKGGTSVAETNAPGKVIFDNFQFAGNSAPPAAPTVTSISPTSGSTSGGTSVTITGTNFVSGATVSLGGSAATGVTVVSSTSITATTTAHAAGAVNVVVTNPDTQSGTLNSGFTYTSGGGGSETVLLADDFNDNSLDTAKWDPNNLFSGFVDTSLPVAETNQQFEVGPLLQNTSGSHYRGIKSVNTYSFSGAYSYVELVQAPSSSTVADAMFTVGANVDNYYRLYVSGGTLYGLRKVGGAKTTLFTLAYNTTNHRFLRIRHDASTGNVTLDTATGSAGVPGTWVQQYSETWNPSIALTGIIFEVKGGTSVAETNAPGKAIFDNFKAAIPGSGGGSGSPPPTGAERLDPNNRTGGGGDNPLSRNFNWNTPLVQLPGRAGLDLGISLAYNSLVWTKTGSSISFDDDHGFPSPGFHLGFPVIQLFFNSLLNQNGYLFLAPDGSRVELRQVGATTLYQAVDSSYLLFNSSTLKLQTGDGTELSYAVQGNDLQCTQIKDRNGNFITINYTSFGRVDTVIDTLNRTIKFNYDANNALTSITQTWTINGSAVTHTWASFEYRNPNLTISTNFTGLTVFGAQNGATIKVLSRVILADNSRYEFDYTSWGQVSKISRIANDGVTLLNYRSYNLPLDNSSAQTDCPRFTERHDFAKYWNRDTNGTEQEAITSFAAPASTSWTMPDNTSDSGTVAQVTSPDGTFQKIYSHSSGWDKGLPVLNETYDSSQVRQRQVTAAWTQDNTALTVPLNPRVTETNLYDPAGNRKRTRIGYVQISLPDGTACSLPQDLFEYDANATTVLRSTRTTYNTNSAYTSRRIIGLVSDKSTYEGDVTGVSTLVAKSGFQYDETGSIQGSDAPVQHDNANFSSAFVAGRANLSSVRRYDVTNIAQFTSESRKYNTAGSVVLMSDASNHASQLSYSDSFSDGISRNSLAYATTTTDPDGYTSSTKYNYDFGAATYVRTPQPNTTQNLPGPEQTLTYDSAGRLDRITNLVNNSYSRFLYGPNYIESWSTVNTVADEAHSLQIVDGAARTIATAMNHPGSTGGFSGQLIVYDAMGRAVKQSNPTETSITIQPAIPINPFSWAAVGDDATGGWIYSQQTYDWKGRPLVTTNQNGTTKIASYSGCGCAGGEVVTYKDEGGGTKRRMKKIYSDVLGRQVKTEVYTWEDGAVYATTVDTYNGRNQVMQSRAYAGAEGSGTFQDTTFAYDGYGRLQSRHLPEQSVNTATVWTYNVDDTVNSITDARGATTTFGYTGTQRHLVKSLTHTLSGSQTINVSFSYDAVGNRLLMTDTMGSVSYTYDQLSRLTSETRGLPVGNFTINYGYNLVGQLSSVTDPFGASFSYTRDLQGRLKTVSGSLYANVTSYVTDVQYRAWGSPKSVGYGNTTTATIGYGFRLEPRQFRLTANSNGNSVMREDYSYYADGSLSSLTDLDDTPGTNPPATLRFLSRTYAYDHAGRIVDAHGTGAGSMPGVPFAQAYGYDQFNNTTSRSGSYYNYTFQQPTTDTATYVNNRRTNWNYNAEGQVLATPSTSTDAPRTMAYDAAGRLISSVETGQFSTVTYTAAYDGDGEVAFESSVTNPGTTQTSYIVRSTVLGDILTRLDQSGNKKITHVPAEDLLFATQRTDGPGPVVFFTQRNPLDISETTKAVYDPLGNYIPFQASSDPRPPAGSYSSASMGGLSSSQANPYSYAVGCMLDGIPTACNKVLHALNNGQGKTLQIDGRQNPNVVLASNGIFIVEYPTDTTKKTPPTWRPKQPNPKPGNQNPYNIGRDEHTWGFALISFENNSQTGPKPPTDCERFVDHLMEHVDKIGASVTQRAIGAAMAAEARYTLADLARQNKLGYSGFKPELIAGGQNGWALVHIQGVAGASLAGVQSVVDDQLMEDKNQLEVGRKWKAMGRKVIPYSGNSEYPLDKYIAEKEAEIADDNTGISAAAILYEKMNGKKDWILTQAALLNLMCDQSR